MIGFFGVVESNQRQQEEPRGHAEGAGQCGDAHGIEQGVHACLDEKRNDDAQNSPYGRTDVRFVEDRSQRDGRQHGAESVETFGDVGSRCLEDEGCEERQRRSDGRPQRGPAVREPETGEEQNARYPVVDEKDLCDAFEPIDDQVSQSDVSGCGEGCRKRRIAHVGRRKSVQGAGGQQEHPCAEDEGEGERIDLPRSHHVVETRAHPCREGRAENERQPHPDGVAHERRECAADQRAVEAPEALCAVGRRQPEPITRERGDGDARERAPCRESLPFPVGTPEDAGHEEQTGPCAVLEHHLSRAAHQDFQKFERKYVRPIRCSDCVCHIRIRLLGANASLPPRKLLGQRFALDFGAHCGAEFADEFLDRGRLFAQHLVKQTAVVRQASDA